MKLVPLEHEPQCPLREGAVHDAVEDADGNVVASVRGVEMGRVVLPVQDRDDDAEEAAYLWHVSSLLPVNLPERHDPPDDTPVHTGASCPFDESGVDLTLVDAIRETVNAVRPETA